MGKTAHIHLVSVREVPSWGDRAMKELMHGESRN